MRGPAGDSDLQRKRKNAGTRFATDSARKRWARETLVASLNETFGPSNWGLGFEDDDVLIQFNYIQEGEFWYDIEYPDIELPSIVAQNINSLERFDVRWELIPRIMPRGVVNYLPAVIDAKNRGTTPFHYLTAVESFTATDLERIEQLRNQIESGFSLVSDKKLMMNSLKVDRTGSYFVRNGFVWDGVRWDGSAPPEGYKRIWIVPSWVYLAGIATILATLFLVWNRLGNVRSLPARSGIKVAIFLGALSLALIATTNGMIGLFTMLLAAPVIAYRRWPIKIRRYVLAVGLFSLLEIYWGGLFANSENTIGAILISVALYCLAALPLLYIRKHLYSFAIFVLLTIIVSTNYAIQDLYYTFFNDYASVRMLGYAYQVPQIADSIVELLGAADRGFYCGIAWGRPLDHGCYRRLVWRLCVGVSDGQKMNQWIRRHCAARLWTLEYTPFRWTPRTMELVTSW